MIVVVKLFGVVIAILGSIFFLNPKVMKQYVAFWVKEKRIYAGALSSLLFGIVFLLAASQSRLAWFMVLMGILALIKGVALFVLGPERLKFWLGWWQERGDIFLRIYALLPISIGILLICSA